MYNLRKAYFTEAKPQHIVLLCRGFEAPTLGLTIQPANHWTRAHLVEQENNQNAALDVPTAETIRDHDTEKQNPKQNNKQNQSSDNRRRGGTRIRNLMFDKTGTQKLKQTSG